MKQASGSSGASNKSPFELVQDAEGTVFNVLVSPGASRNRILGEHAGSLKASVSAPPEKGKANSALLKLLAGAMGVNTGDLTIISGETTRMKRVLLRGRNMQQTWMLLNRAAGL
jgi:uncharacterized protein (TIGR00251 family)